MNTTIETASGMPGEPWTEMDKALRKTLTTARAAAGMTWDEVSAALRDKGWDITPGNLMTRQSRMSFRADEYLLLLHVLGVENLSVKAHAPAD